ncbi:formate dehydrogenase subunit delta [Aquincola sp. MAHUQ-54]|uniref:Formate dehydrogenase subunit delta n=1 Tax=Aquincola agrisoli TaxID=3119538 RepID=A0AAW9Q9T3_9BURK
MPADNLVRMANRIGQFFDAMPDRAEALEGVAQHIQKFWEPRMRRALQAHIDDPAALAAVPLDPFVLEALRAHPQVLAATAAAAAAG